MSERDADSTADLPTLRSADALEAVPGYTLIRVLAEGTQARAYECRAERSGEIVVVKVLTKQAALDRNAVQRMLRENRVIAGLRAHENVARVVDVGEAAAGPYVAFERLPTGRDLRTLLVKNGRFPVSQALSAVRDAARAVEAASHVGVAHRDIKPSNLFLLDDGSVKLTDFGFAAPLSRLGGPEGVYGTPAFVAPELVRGAPADVRTDIYALGATLFQLVTARPLFEGPTPDVLAAHQKKPVPSIATMVPDAGIAVVDILYRLLHKDPSRRPQTAGEVAKLLDDAVARALRGTASGPVAAAPAPSEPQWPTMAPPRPAPKPRAAQQREERAAPPQVSSPFDAGSSEMEVSNPYAAQPTGVMGTLKQMSVTEIIQMLEIGKKSASIEVHTAPETGVPLKGVVHVHDGQLVACTANEQTGEPAVVTLCTQKEGFFRIHYEKEPCEKNIHRPTTFVLLEAMRHIDETSSSAPAPAPAAHAPAAARAPAAGPVTSSPVPPLTAPHSGADTPAKPTMTPRPPPRAGTPLPSLAKPRVRTGEGAPVWPQQPPAQRAEPTQAGKPKPVSGIGDGIQFVDGAGADIDDVTLREPLVVQRPPLMVAKERASALWARVAPALRGASAKVTPAARRMWATTAREVPAALEPLRPALSKVHPKLGEVPPVAVVAVALGAVLAVVLGVAAAAHTQHATMPYDVALTKVQAGDAADVIQALDGDGERSPAQDLVLADAYAALGEPGRALELYEDAFPAATDALEADFLLDRLDASAPDDEIDMLVLWPDPSVDERLAAETLDVRAAMRTNAAAVLVERGNLAPLDLEQTAILDLMPREGSCASRRAAMAALAAAGKTRAALDVVDRVGRAGDSCFETADISAAYKAIKRRL